MPFFVTWLTADHVIAEREFEDLFKAERYLRRNGRKFREQGATAAKVWNGRATYFQIEWSGEAGKSRVVH